MRRSQRLRLADLPRIVLRALIGVAGLFGGRYRRSEGANVLVTDEEGRILVVRTTYLGPGWMLPGGHLERDETPHDGAVRETQEETGLRVEIERLVLVDARRPGEVSFVFAAKLIDGTMAPQLGEIAEVGWLHRDEIARTSPPLHQLLAYLDAAGDGVAYLGLDRDPA